MDRKKPSVRPQHKMKHLKYAKENIEKPEAFLTNVLWTDKTKSNFLATFKEGIFCVWMGEWEASIVQLFG